MKQTYAYFAILVAMIFWGISFVWSKSLFNAGLNPIFVITARLFLSGGLLWMVLKSLGRLNRIAVSDIKWFFALAFFEPFLYFFGDSYGVLWTSASMASIFIATIPIFVPFAMYLFYKERIRSSNLVGVLISLLGIALMVLNHQFELAADPKGIAILLLAVFAASSYSVLLSKLVSKYSTYTIITYQNLIGFLYYLPLFLLFDFRQLFQVSFTSKMIIDIVLLSVLCSALAFILYTYTVKRIGISRTSVFTNLIPVFTLFFAVFMGQEAFTWRKIAGMSLVISGVILSQTPSLKSVLQRCKIKK